jgi:3-methyladenine DNA glycosylase AlkC
MAEPLKNQYGPDVPRRIAKMIRLAWPQFPHDRFLRDALKGYEALELMPRGRHIAGALRAHLPEDFDQAIEILLASLDNAPPDRTGAGGLAPFLYLPHTMYVADYGLAHFDTAMRAQYELTQRFTAEFSIRPFLLQHTQATLQRLHTWAGDANERVRRLVSEGTRPRLPWAIRLPMFQRDPAPVLALLERLKDDPALYVRRSVANNLNDIGKDNPQVLTKTARQWRRNASTQRQWIIRHALRSLVRQGDAGALSVLGFPATANVTVSGARLSPARVREGEAVTVNFALHNPTRKKQALLVDFRIHYIKANGHARPKVFKLKSVELAADETMHFSKKVSLAPMTTRRHYPGRHQVDALINGQVFPLGAFTLTEVA